jgi:hypothetical protein
MWKQILYETSLYGKGKIDETLAKLHERKHSTKEEKKERRERTQFQARRAKPKVGHGGGIKTNHVPKLSPIAKISSIARSISERGGIASEQIMFQNPHQSQEAYQKEKGMERVKA